MRPDKKTAQTPAALKQIFFVRQSAANLRRRLKAATVRPTQVIQLTLSDSMLLC